MPPKNKSARSLIPFITCVVAAVLGGRRPAVAEVPLVQFGGWQFFTDGRLNTFFSLAEGTSVPADQPDNAGAGTADYANANGDIHSARIRNGFLMSILGFTGETQVTPTLKVTTRVALWMNITGTRSKNIPGLVDPRELYAKLEGPWGSVLAGSDLALFGRGATLMDARIAHEYGLGYPCDIRFASGGGCGMVAFGEPFPGFEPGVVYATPDLRGLQISIGAYDPATIDNAQLDRAPLPRVEGEVRLDVKNVVRLFASGFWQALEGTVTAMTTGGTPYAKNLHVDAWGAQAGAMLSLGPILLGGAAYEGAGFSPITYIDESVIAADSAGVLRDSRGAFGLGAILISPLRLKIAGGVGVWHLDKNRDDGGAVSPSGAPANPQLIKQNVGETVGLYQSAGPIRFALEYFRAQHTWYDRGIPSSTDPTMTVGVTTPRQTVNFINAGMTVIW